MSQGDVMGWRVDSGPRLLETEMKLRETGCLAVRLAVAELTPRCLNEIKFTSLPCQSLIGQ